MSEASTSSSCKQYLARLPAPMREAFKKMSRDDRRQFLEAMRFEGSIHSSDIETASRAPSSLYEPLEEVSFEGPATAAVPFAVPAVPAVPVAAPLLITPSAVGETVSPPVAAGSPPVLGSMETLLPVTVGASHDGFTRRLQVTTEP